MSVNPSIRSRPVRRAARRPGRSTPRNTSPLEKAEQLGIRDLMRKIGAKEYVLGNKRRKGDYPGTMQTPGIPDMHFFLPRRGPVDPTLPIYRTKRLVMVEAKREKGGTYSLAQKEYRGLCAAAGIDYIGGSLNDAITWLCREGYLKPDQVAWYRRPPEIQPDESEHE